MDIQKSDQTDTAKVVVKRVWVSPIFDRVELKNALSGDNVDSSGFGGYSPNGS